MDLDPAHYVQFILCPQRLQTASKPQMRTPCGPHNVIMPCRQICDPNILTFSRLFSIDVAKVRVYACCT